LNVSNRIVAKSTVFLTSTSGPVVSNGVSAIWNSNGYATYLRTSLPGSTTYSDVLLGVHVSP
jgi:hypothetical protein